jgi:hypothetical protein
VNLGRFAASVGPVPPGIRARRPAAPSSTRELRSGNQAKPGPRETYPTASPALRQAAATVCAAWGAYAAWTVWQVDRAASPH